MSREQRPFPPSLTTAVLAASLKDWVFWASSDGHRAATPVPALPWQGLGESFPHQGAWMELSWLFLPVLCSASSSLPAWICWALPVPETGREILSRVQLSPGVPAALGALRCGHTASTALLVSAD